MKDEEKKKKAKDLERIGIQRDIDKKEESIEDHKHRLEIYKEAKELIDEKIDILEEKNKLQIDNYGFTDNFEPKELYEEMPEYVELMKRLQRVMNKENIIQVKEEKRKYERFTKKTYEDLSSLKVELEHQKKHLKELKGE